MTSLLLQNGSVIDGTGREPLERASILIKGGRISAVDRVDKVRPPAECRVVDVSERTVMLGMIDCHFHGAYQDVTCWEDYDLRRPIEHTTLLAGRNAQTLLEVGFAAARDTGTRGLIAVAIRDLAEAGVLMAPRLKAGGRIISSTGGLADAYGDWVENRTSLGQVADGPMDVLKAVRQQIKYGVDNIKIEASGTGISPYSASRKQTMSREEMAIAVGEAHRNGVRVACHAQATEGIKNAVRAGVETVEHGSFLDEEGAALMKEAGTLLVPTISVLYLYVYKGPDVGVPVWVVEKFKGDLDAHIESVKLALETGIPMSVGSDSRHSFNPQSVIAVELELMVKTGFAPMQVLVAATANGARAIGLDDAGELVPGKLGDVLVVNGQPLDDIRVLQDCSRLECVYQGGRLVAGSAASRREELELGYQLAPAEVDRPCCLAPCDELETI